MCGRAEGENDRWAIITPPRRRKTRLTREVEHGRRHVEMSPPVMRGLIRLLGVYVNLAAIGSVNQTALY